MKHNKAQTASLPTALLLLLAAFINGPILHAQYSTPGFGQAFTMEDLVELSDGTVLWESDHFTVNADLSITGADTLLIEGEVEVHFAEAVLLTIEGALLTAGGAKLTTANCCESHWGGIRFESSSHGRLQNSEITYGGGIRVLTPNFEAVNCHISHHSAVTSTGGAIGLSGGMALISHCTFEGNAASAISSPANINTAPRIEHCHFEGNNTSNANRPQINLGPSGADTTYIVGNWVVGGNPSLDQTGGIAVSSLLGNPCHAVIDKNVVIYNRYGVAVIGNNIHSRITGNGLNYNNIQEDPMLGGSGINLNSTGANSHVILSNNILGNHWGITLQGTAQANIGEIDNPEVGPGLNYINYNQNEGGLFDLYNNTSNTIMAQENCWTPLNWTPTVEDVESVIFHQNDDPELGEVIFIPFIACGYINSTSNTSAYSSSVYPNPTQGEVSLKSNFRMRSLALHDMSGRMVREWTVEGSPLETTLRLDGLTPGLYLLRISGAQGSTSTKLVVN